MNQAPWKSIHRLEPSQLDLSMGGNCLRGIGVVVFLLPSNVDDFLHENKEPRLL